MWNLKKQTTKTKLRGKEIRFVFTRGDGEGRQNWRKMVKRYKLTVIR